MKVQADKTGTEKSKAVANTASATHEAGEVGALFEDKRPEAVTQRQLADKADQGSQSWRIGQLQAMANSASAELVQRQESEGEDELLEEPESVQRIAKEEAIQTKSAVVQKKDDKPTNNTGLPETLKSGIESLSGLSMDDVKVHYNSAKPAQLQAHAFAQGTDIHMAPGQEKHLPHEAWHVVQQKQGPVKPTMQMKGEVSVNDDAGLEKEADLMGMKAAQIITSDTFSTNSIQIQVRGIAQRRLKRDAFNVVGKNQPNQATLQRVPSTAAPAKTNTGVVTETKDSTSHNGETVPSHLTSLVHKPPSGSVPSISPPGWQWLRLHFGSLKGKYVRFHILNAELGGSGKDKSNLVPTTNFMNSNTAWRGVEDTAKELADEGWAFLDVQIQYDDSYPAGIPRAIIGETGKWDDKSGSWESVAKTSAFSQVHPESAEGYGTYQPGGSFRQNMTHFAAPADKRLAQELLAEHYADLDEVEEAFDAAEWSDSGKDIAYNLMNNCYLDEDYPRPREYEADEDEGDVSMGEGKQEEMDTSEGEEVVLEYPLIVRLK